MVKFLQMFIKCTNVALAHNGFVYGLFFNRFNNNNMTRKEAKNMAHSRDCHCVKGKDRDNNYSECIDKIFDWHESEVKKLTIHSVSGSFFDKLINLLGYITFAYLLCFLIFGGEFELEIHFKESIEALKHIFNYR